MWGSVELRSRRGIGLAILGIARPQGWSIIGFFFVIAGVVLCLLGAGLIEGRPASPPAFPPGYPPRP